VTGLSFRHWLVESGDNRVAEARRLAGEQANADGFLPEHWVYEYWQVLIAADNAYRAAGLGLLAGRIAFFARRVAEFGERENVRDAWAKFDRLNAGGCGAT
jgi:hypothetical protein